MNRNSNSLPDGSAGSPRNLPPWRGEWTIDRVQRELDAGTWPPEDWESSQSQPEQQVGPEPQENLSDQIAKYHNSLRELGPLEIEDYPSLEELTEEVYSHLVQKSLSQENSTRTPSIQASLLRAMLDL